MPIKKIIVFTSLLLTIIVLSAGNGSTADLSPWAGSYYLGDGLGYNNYLKLSQEGTFAYKWEGCLGTYDENTGGYRLEEGILVLSPERRSIRKSFKGTPTRFLPVAWGRRLYLIPEKESLDFVNEINQGGEPRDGVHGRFYLREGDEKIPVSGFPVLPAQWQDYLLQKPAEGSVTKVQGRKAVINIGKKHGLKEGMLLTARGPKDTRFTQLKVVSVEDETCTAEKLYKDDKVQEGDSVSTRFFSSSQ